MTNTAKILLVEDSKLDIALTLDAFREARLMNQIHVAQNGEEALEYLFGQGKFVDRVTYPLPDIILMDLKMPGIDGLEALRKIKNSEKIKRIPVIILTSSKEDGDRTMSYDLGANSYLVKPISFDGFLDVVKQITDYWISLNIGPPMN